MLSLFKNELEAQGIECVLRGEHLLGGVGELPPIECWPELWVVDEGQQRLVLFLNHVLMQEKQAQDRLLRQKGLPWFHYPELILGN